MSQKRARSSSASSSFSAPYTQRSPRAMVPYRGRSVASKESSLVAKRINRYTRSTLFFASTIVPDRTLVKLKYVVNYNTNTAAATFMYVVLRGNGPFDPEQAAGGLQPTGYDQWSVFYARQRTHASSVSVKGTVGSTGSAAVVALTPSPIVGVSDTATTELARPYVHSKVVGQLNSNNGFSLFHRMTTQKIMGTSVTQDDLFSSTIGANPSQQWYWNFLIESVGGAIVALAWQAVFTITYDVEFYDRNDLSQS